MPTIEFEDGPPLGYLAHAQIIGRSELAAFLRLRHDRTTAAWHRRRILPPGDYPSVNGSVAWRRMTVVRWAAQTNRLPPWLETEGAMFRTDRKRRRRTEVTHAS